MGFFETFIDNDNNELQIKLRSDELNEYKIGDKISYNTFNGKIIDKCLEDGIYITNEGAIVIHNGIYIGNVYELFITDDVSVKFEDLLMERVFYKSIENCELYEIKKETININGKLKLQLFKDVIMIKKDDEIIAITFVIMPDYQVIENRKFLVKDMQIILKYRKEWD